MQGGKKSELRKINDTRWSRWWRRKQNWDLYGPPLPWSLALNHRFGYESPGRQRLNKSLSYLIFIIPDWKTQFLLEKCNSLFFSLKNPTHMLVNPELLRAKTTSYSSLQRILLQSIMGTVLLDWGKLRRMSVSCHNNVPRTGWLKTTDMYSVTVLEARSLRSRCLQGRFLLRLLLLTCRQPSRLCFYTVVPLCVPVS